MCGSSLSVTIPVLVTQPPHSSPYSGTQSLTVCMSVCLQGSQGPQGPVGPPGEMGPKVSAKEPWFVLCRYWGIVALLVSSPTCCLIPVLAYRNRQAGSAETYR